MENEIAFPVKFIANQVANMNAKEFQLLSDTLVSLSEAQAERLKNAIAVSQQERDLNELEKQKQEEMHSYDSDGWFMETCNFVEDM